MPLSQSGRDIVSSDSNLPRADKLFRNGAKTFLSATVKYLADKAPIIQWLPHYSPKWILRDSIAGFTIGALLVPQALAYARIATIPGEFGLLSSWLPPALYAVTETSKGQFPESEVPMGYLLDSCVTS
jgi:sodium-independent sulfate anion transporter 11